MTRALLLLAGTLTAFCHEAPAGEDPLAFAQLPLITRPAASEAPEYIGPLESVLTFRILPDDVVQDSVRQVRFGANLFAIRWTYTESGAQRFLAFREASEGQPVRVLVGSFTTADAESKLRPTRPAATRYAEWKEGWLKRRTTKMFTASEADANAITAGLTRK
jgi:hypothetical protein